MSFVIRAYRPADYDWVLSALIGLQEHERILHDTRLPGDSVTVGAYLDALLARLEKDHGVILLAERGGAPVGLIGVDDPWPLETPDSTLYGYISDIFIRPEHRGSGLAAELFDAMTAHFRALPLPLTRLRVNVLAVNRVACAAYEKAGFAPYEVMYERPLQKP
jgi:RimJ/RimL family protein N-acetyltransferase